jgi:MarR family transcriptional regulator, 2-MHQ and catechol-resistance regulon repressor
LVVVNEPETATLQDARQLQDALERLVRVYQYRDRDRICCYDVSVTQCHALEALVAGGTATLNELAALLYLDKSTTSRVVDALERKGYLTRARSPEDGRALELHATAAGRKLVERIREDLLGETAALLANVSPELRAATAAVVGGLADAAAARAGVAAPLGCCPPARQR